MTGAHIDLGALLDPAVAMFALLLALSGVITKAAGGMLGAWSIGRWGAITVGFGMIPRGEVGIIVANLGLAAGLLHAELFSAVIVAVVLTTVVAPYLLAWSIPRAIEQGPRAPGASIRGGRDT